MQQPNLSQIVDAVVQITEQDPEHVIRILRDHVAPAIRALQEDGDVTWFCVHLHNRESADRKDLPDDFPDTFLHFRFGLHDEAQRARFIASIPDPFQFPVPRSLGAIGGLDAALMRGEWADAWRLIGEISDLALKLAETHRADDRPLLPQLLSFLHYLTNGLGIGMRSIYFAGPIRHF